MARKKPRKKKTSPTAARPDAAATHGRDQFPSPPKLTVKPPPRRPGRGMR
jgi:hypothetical protein